jgi:hypothetical protein
VVLVEFSKIMGVFDARSGFPLRPPSVRGLDFEDLWIVWENFGWISKRTGILDDRSALPVLGTFFSVISLLLNRNLAGRDC